MFLAQPKDLQDKITNDEFREVFSLGFWGDEEDVERAARHREVRVDGLASPLKGFAAAAYCKCTYTVLMKVVNVCGVGPKPKPTSKRPRPRKDLLDEISRLLEVKQNLENENQVLKDELQDLRNELVKALEELEQRDSQAGTLASSSEGGHGSDARPPSRRLRSASAARLE